MAKRRLWTREEMILAFNLYLQLPFGKMAYRTKEVIELSYLINRTPSAVAMRLVNYAAVDPFHASRGVKGLIAGSKRCKPIFEEFNNDRDKLLYEGEEILSRYQGINIEEKYQDELPELRNYTGETKTRYIKTRVNQNLFRRIILSNYNSKCGISEIDIPSLLVASHIKPWAIDENNRLNPSNGICLNNLYDKAFDRGLIGFKSDYSIIFSDDLKKEHKKDYFKKYFEPIEYKKLTLPQRFLPEIKFLEYHLEYCFNR